MVQGAQEGLAPSRTTEAGSKKKKNLLPRSFLPYLQFSYIPAFLYPQGVQIIVNNPTVEAVHPGAQTNSYKWKENGLIACY